MISDDISRLFYLLHSYHTAFTHFNINNSKVLLIIKTGKQTEPFQTNNWVIPRHGLIPHPTWMKLPRLPLFAVTPYLYVCSLFYCIKATHLNILEQICLDVLLDNSHSLASPAGGSAYIHNTVFWLRVCSVGGNLCVVASIWNPVYTRMWTQFKSPLKWGHAPSRNHSSSHAVLCLVQILSGVILEVLGEAFTEVITAEVASAWTKLLDNMCCGLTAVYKEAGWTEQPPSAEWRAPVHRSKRRFNWTEPLQECCVSFECGVWSNGAPVDHFGIMQQNLQREREWETGSKVRPYFCHGENA